MTQNTRVDEGLKVLNLASIVSRIVRREGWSLERANLAEAEYREFLRSAALSPEVPMAPSSEDMDVVWHYHILDTQKYLEDCVALFGGFMHHVPTDGDLSTQHESQVLLKTCESRRSNTCDSRMASSTSQKTCDSRFLAPISLH